MTKVEILKQKRAALRAEMEQIEKREPYFAEPARRTKPGRRSNSELYQGLLPYKKPKP